MEALGVGEGLAVGILKERLKEAVLDGDLPNEHAAAVDFVRTRRRRPPPRRLFDHLRASLRDQRARPRRPPRRLATDPVPDDDDAAWDVLMREKDRLMSPGGIGCRGVIGDARTGRRVKSGAAQDAQAGASRGAGTMYRSPAPSVPLLSSSSRPIP